MIVNFMRGGHQSAFVPDIMVAWHEIERQTAFANQIGRQMRGRSICWQMWDGMDDVAKMDNESWLSQLDLLQGEPGTFCREPVRLPWSSLILSWKSDMSIRDDGKLQQQFTRNGSNG